MRGGKQWAERRGEDCVGGRSSLFPSLQDALLPHSLCLLLFSQFSSNWKQLIIREV